MTGVLMPVVGLRAVDTTGEPLAGALLQFYLTGTTTPSPVYTDKTLTTPLSNPVLSDGAGLFPPMFCDPTISYRAQLKNSGGTVLQDVDPASEPAQIGVGAIAASMLAAGAAASNLGFSPVNKAGDTATNLLIAASSLSNTSAGFRGAPTNTQNANYTFALSDSGGCVTCSTTGGYTWTIPPNSSVAFPQGTVILVRNRAAGAITIAPASGVVLRKAGISGSASVSLAIWGFASMMQDETNEWVISGSAIT